MEDLGNLFLEESKDLVILDTKVLGSPAILETVSRIEDLGKEQYEKFITKRLLQRSVSLYDPIKKNKLPLFNSPPVKVVSSQKHY